MPSEPKFTDANPLDYYYLHGYKIINPFCRIITAHPQYAYFLAWRDYREKEKDKSWMVMADSVATKILFELKATTDSKSWDLLQLDEPAANIFANDASKEQQALAVEFAKFGAQAPSERELMAGSRKQARDRLALLSDLLAETRKALEARPSPSSSWLIRGDSQGMIRYLTTQGIAFPEPAAVPSWRSFQIPWRTNQFFSTSDGDELASVAGHALVWVIRINPGKTKGRIGGLYVSETEVLFPYDTEFFIEGGIDVASEKQIGELQLNAFSQAEKLRAKLLEIYRANQTHWKNTNQKARFLVVTER